MKDFAMGVIKSRRDSVERGDNLGYTRLCLDVDQFPIDSFAFRDIVLPHSRRMACSC